MSLPPGPSSILGPMLRFLVDPYGMLPACLRRYGDPFNLPIPGTKGTLVTAQPDGIRQIMSADPATFIPFTIAGAEPLMGRYSIFLQSGATHRAARKILKPPLHGAAMRSHGDTVQMVALRVLAARPSGAPFSFRAAAQTIALETIVRTILGVTDPDRVAVFEEAIIEGLESLGPAILHFEFLRRHYGGYGPWAKALRTVGRVNRLIAEELVARRRGTWRGTDMLSALVDARFEDGTPMSDDDIRDKLFDLIIAGYDTSSGALTWGAYEITKNPRVRSRLEAELAGVEPLPERFMELPYLDAVCHETLRRHPPIVFVSRRLARNFTLLGREVPEGHGVSIAIAAAHRREDAYPDAQAFRPERFIERRFSAFEFLPFGGGVERCIGASFAMQEMKIALGTIFTRHRLELRQRRSVRPVPRTLSVGPSGPVQMAAFAR